MEQLTELNKDVNRRFIMVYDNLKERKIVNRKSEFCASLDMPKEYFSRIEKMTRSVPDQYLETLSKKYQISKAWLISGEGDMFESNFSPGNFIKPRSSNEMSSSLEEYEYQIQSLKLEVEHYKKRLNFREIQLSDRDELIEELRVRIEEYKQEILFLRDKVK